MIYTKIIDNLYLGSYSDVINNTYEDENIELIKLVVALVLIYSNLFPNKIPNGRH